MNQNIKKQWVEALRSGRYEQGKGMLRREDKFCCLGVLCDLHAQATNREWEEDGLTRSYLGRISVLPVEVVNWAGFYSEDPFLREEKISTHNDVRELDFDQMSDLIESNL